MEILFVVAVVFVVLLAIMGGPARKRSGAPVKYRHTSTHGAGGDRDHDDNGWWSGDSGSGGDGGWSSGDGGSGGDGGGGGGD